MASNRLFLAFREPGPSWVPGVPTRQQPLWDEHAAFMDDLFARGHVVLAGPYADWSRALVILDAGDAAEAVALLRGDPWAKAGIRVAGEIIGGVVFLDPRKPGGVGDNRPNHPPQRHRDSPCGRYIRPVRDPSHSAGGERRHLVVR